MTHCCSQCGFTAQFESALMMHRQLHHEPATLEDYPELSTSKLLTEKANTLPRATMDSTYSGVAESKGYKLPTRTSSATRLFDKLRARICRSRTLFAHPEESGASSVNVNEPVPSECTSKGFRVDSMLTRGSAVSAMREAQKETFGCHLCTFDADRITVLDRHLLNDHKIGLDNLLKLVLAKTKDGLAEDVTNSTIYGIRQPYYRPPDEIIEEGEFVVETVTPKIKILKHASTNTEILWTDMPDLKDCQMISKELANLISNPVEEGSNKEFLAKMQSLNEYMCKFVDSSNTLKKVLAKELDSKLTPREHLNGDEPFFNLGLGEDTPRDWERAHNEKLERSRNKYGENCRGDKSKNFSESFYF